MKDFIFSNTTKVYFGKDQLQHLGGEVKRFGQKVLLVYGGGSIKKIGLYDKVMAELKKAGLTVYELPGVEPNPHHTTVNKGAALCKAEGIEVILAVGGGSTFTVSSVENCSVLLEDERRWGGKNPSFEIPATLPLKFLPHFF